MDAGKMRNSLSSSRRRESSRPLIPEYNVLLGTSHGKCVSISSARPCISESLPPKARGLRGTIRSECGAAYALVGSKVLIYNVLHRGNPMLIKLCLPRLAQVILLLGALSSTTYVNADSGSVIVDRYSAVNGIKLH